MDGDDRRGRGWGPETAIVALAGFFVPPLECEYGGCGKGGVVGGGPGRLISEHSLCRGKRGRDQVFFWGGGGARVKAGRGTWSSREPQGTFCHPRACGQSPPRSPRRSPAPSLREGPAIEMN